VRRPSLFAAFVRGVAILVAGMALSFLAGAGTGAIWERLVPQAPDIIALHNDEPGIKVIEDKGVVLARINPRAVRLDLARGWEVEQTAFQDRNALLYFTGPFFEELKGENDYDARAIGDTYFYGTLTAASDASRAFADRRYYMGITRRRSVIFGFGGWKKGFDRKFRVFVGGLGFLYDRQGEQPDATYSDPYSNFRQRLHEAVPRERLIVGKDEGGHLMVLKTPPRTSAQAAQTARAEGLLEAYYVDQGNKARFIVPGQIDDRPRFNLPYLLRVAERDQAWVPPQDLPRQQAKPRRKKRHRRHAAATPAPEALPPQTE